MKENSGSSATEQAERARLREDYIRTLVAMTNKQARVKMYEKIKINAVFKACCPDGEKIIVSDVNVPVGGILPTAIFRSSDVISIDFE